MKLNPFPRPQITCNDLGIGRSVDETLRLVESIQFNLQHGEGE